MKNALFLTIAAAVLSLSGGVAVASDAKLNNWVYGEGIGSCAEFLKDEKINVQNGYDAQWILGWVSAAALYLDTKKSLGEVAEYHGIMHLIRDYCDANPLDKLHDAAVDVTKQLIKRAGGDPYQWLGNPYAE